ncbi:MAG: hypothetical protein KKB51_13885 [Candidatus Riflebacteria bacterium]|nr:hypothetical protein [Candidatus Riflebacteria bacterium]
MKSKNLFFLFVIATVLLPTVIFAQANVSAQAKDNLLLNCSVDFRIFEIKNETCFNKNILGGKIGFERKISRMTVEIVKINATEKQKANSPLPFKWLQANANELDFKTIMLNKAEINTLKEIYKKNRKNVFTYKIQVAVQEENGTLVGYAHLLGEAVGSQIQWK